VVDDVIPQGRRLGSALRLCQGYGWRFWLFVPAVREHERSDFCTDSQLTRLLNIGPWWRLGALDLPDRRSTLLRRLPVCSTRSALRSCYSLAGCLFSKARTTWPTLSKGFWSPCGTAIGN
jgi:hypothetical protein